MKKPASAFTALLASIALVSCGGGGGSTASTPSGAAAAPAPTPTPTATPSTSITPSGPATASAGFVIGTNTTAGFPQLDKIATNFATDGMVRPAWGTGAIPIEEGPSVGAFRFLCKPSHLSYDDPIVYPKQAGKAHLHMFFGNTLADANSDYNSLRTTGESTCNNKLNRSAYWVPALMNGRGQVIMPDHISVYYKRWPNSHAYCKEEGKPCIGLPRGLRYVFGRTMDGKGGMSTYFVCSAEGVDPTKYATLAEAAKGCPIGAKIGAVAIAGSCWDGKYLDTPDHRSHMAELEYNPANGHPRCPSTHPYRIPTFQLGVWYIVDETLDRTGNMSPDAQTWFFSSDRMRGMAAQTSGATFHADWYGAWDDDTLATWVDNCIDKFLSCSGGDLGNGTQISYSEPFLRSYPALVAVPTDPKFGP